MSSEGHMKKVKDVRTNTKICSYFASVPSVANMSPLEAKVRRAEVKMTTTMAKHNVSLAIAEHLSPLRKCFQIQRQLRVMAVEEQRQHVF